MADNHGLKFLPLLALALMLGGCLNTDDASRGVYLIAEFPEGEVGLTEELEAVVDDLLMSLRPGDALAVERADRGVREGMYLDGRPSRAAAQIQALATRLEATARREPGERQRGELVDSVERGIHFLGHPRIGQRVVILFSDLRGEPPRGLPDDLSKYEFVAINSELWRGESSQAWAYLRRIDNWQRAVEGRGGHWRVMPLNGNLGSKLLDEEL